MSLPRPVYERPTTYLVTRKCAEERFFLRPSTTTNDVFTYLLAVAAERYGIQVHVFCVLSNHCHLVVTDPGARLPDFMRFLNAFVARALNAALGRFDAFWDLRPYSAVELVSADDIVQKAAYALANPAAAGLVRSGRLWPGLWSDPERIGGAPIEIARPNHFFSKSGTFPERASLKLTAPPAFASAAEFRERVLKALGEQEKAAAEKYATRGFLGAAKVLRQSPWKRPSSAQPRRVLSPRVAARDTWQRIEALSRLKKFFRDYRQAWTDWRAGKRDVVFPAGTYLMRVLHGVPCAAAG